MSSAAAGSPSSDGSYVRDGAFSHGGGKALVFEVAPTTAFGFGKGTFSQTRWRFPAR